MSDTENREAEKSWRELRVQLCLGATLVLTVVGLSVLLGSGPEYQGKSGRYWFSVYNSAETAHSELAITAFRAMGSNVVPMLIAELEATPSRMDPFLSALFNRFRSFPRDYLQQINWRRDRAAELLFEMGEAARPATPALEKAATDPMWYIQTSAKATLIRLRNESLAPHIELLKDRSDPIKWYPNAMLLGKFGTNAQTAVPLLIQSLQDSDQIIQAHALIALGMIKSNPQVCVPAVIPFLTNANVSLRQKAYFAILAFADHAERATEAIAVGLHDSDPWTKRRAVIAVAKILSPAEQRRVLPQVEALLNDPEPFISDTAKEWLPIIHASASK